MKAAIKQTEKQNNDFGYVDKLNQARCKLEFMTIAGRLMIADEDEAHAHADIVFGFNLIMHEIGDVMDEVVVGLDKQDQARIR